MYLNVQRQARRDLDLALASAGLPTLQNADATLKAGIGKKIGALSPAVGASSHLPGVPRD